jgi:histidinol-phosphate aminotransferase
LLKVKVPFEPSYFAQVAGCAALDDNKFMEKTIRLNIKEKSKIESSIDVLGVTRIPSATNFVTTFWESEEKAESIAEKLLDKGIIVRQLNAFGWPEYIRISIGLEHENDQFIQTLASII